VSLIAFREPGLLRIDAVGIGACIVASVIGYATLVGPLLQHRSAAAGLRHEMETRYDKVVELDSAIATAKTRMTALQQQLAAGSIQLESAAHINRRIAGLTGSFSKCDLHVDDVQTGQVFSCPQYDLVPITIVGRGTYQRCVKLLHELSRMFPDTSVMRIDLAGNPAESAQSEKFRLDLFWYATPSRPARNTASNSRFETRNPKQIQDTKDRNAVAGPGPVWDFRFGTFELVSDVEIRASDSEGWTDLRQVELWS